MICFQVLISPNTSTTVSYSYMWYLLYPSHFHTSHLRIFIHLIALIFLSLVTVRSFSGAAVALPLQHVADDHPEQAQEEKRHHEGKCCEVMVVAACRSIVLDRHITILR